MLLPPPAQTKVRCECQSISLTICVPGSFTLLGRTGPRAFSQHGAGDPGVKLASSGGGGLAAQFDWSLTLETLVQQILNYFSCKNLSPVAQNWRRKLFFWCRGVATPLDWREDLCGQFSRVTFPLQQGRGCDPSVALCASRPKRRSTQISHMENNPRLLSVQKVPD